MHPNRQFPDLFVDHMPSCLYVLLRVTHPLCSLGGCKGIVPSGMFPWRCEDTVVGWSKNPGAKCPGLVDPLIAWGH